MYWTPGCLLAETDLEALVLPVLFAATARACLLLAPVPCPSCKLDKLLMLLPRLPAGCNMLDLLACLWYLHTPGKQAGRLQDR